ncbi:MAG: DnaA ATPase domain-containing protein [Pirellula sp.]
MRIAQEVAVRHDQLLRAVEATLRQRLGKQRWEFWFGTHSVWSVPVPGTIRVEVETAFHADFIKQMLRKDLQCSVTQAAGTDWGFEVVSAADKTASIPAAGHAASSQITYDEGDLGTSGGSTALPASGPAALLSKSTPTVTPATARTSSQSLATADSGLRESVAAELGLEQVDSSVAGDMLLGNAGHPDTALNREQVAAEREAFLAELRDAEMAPAPSVGLRVVRPEALAASDAVASRSSSPSRMDASAPTIDPADLEMERLVAIRRQNERRWEDFIVGDHNRFAYTGAQMVIEQPGQISPFLIHGPHGVGKSHLAAAIVQRLRQLYRYKRVLSLTGEQFTIEYTESAKGGGFANFRRKYRDVEALVIDDIQFCLGKAGTLVELRNTIDMLLRDRRQVILVADRGIHELAGLGGDLYARLSGGMSCGVEPMDAATRCQLLHKLCLKHEVPLSTDAAEQIARQCGGDARVLQGIVHRLVAQQRILGARLTSDDAVRCTSDLVRASQPIVRLSDIEKAVCTAFGLGDEMLRAKTKCQNISQPRMLAMFLARKYTRSALSEIGEHFGHRQHSTVISAQKKVESWLTTDDAIQVGLSRVPVREIVRGLESALQVS